MGRALPDQSGCSESCIRVLIGTLLVRGLPYYGVDREFCFGL